MILPSSVDVQDNDEELILFIQTALPTNNTLTTWMKRGGWKQVVARKGI